MANSDMKVPIVKSSLVGGYNESRRDSETAKARAEAGLFEVKKSVEELALLIERSNRGPEFKKIDMEVLKIEEKYAEVMRVLEAVKEEVSEVKLDVSSVLGERIAAEKEVEELRFKTERNMILLESLKKEIEVANEEHLMAALRKIEALRGYKEIERQRERRAIEVLDLLVERNKRIKKMLEEAERSKDIENELFETNSDVEMLEIQLKLFKKMERRVQGRDSSMSRSNRSFGRGKYSLSVLKEVTEATEGKKEELASVNVEIFRIMTVMDALRNEIIRAKDETARLENILRKDDVQIQKLNSNMLIKRSKLEAVSIAEERISSLADNLVGSLEKLRKSRKAAKKEELLLKEEKTLDELDKVKHTEALVLEKLETIVEDTMESREMESEHCSTITISRFEYEYLSKHASQAEETAVKKVAAAEAWVEALKASTKSVLMKSDTLMRESEMVRVEEEKELFRMERSLSTKRLVEGEIQKFKQNSETEGYISPKPVGKFTPVQRGKPRRYSSVGTPTFFNEGTSSLETALNVFWNNQREQLGNFAGQTYLPLSRVRKILKSNPEVKKISCDVPALFSKACEYFILEVTLRAWMNTQSCTRQTIRRCDIFQAVKNSGTYDFLIDRVPFGPHCVVHQGVPTPAEMILPDMNIPIDMNETEQENLTEECSINNRGFDLNSDLQ
ncbi:Transcription factor CBF/NF-Y/archaeal histone domain [Arabidopsis thaliana x Arabidopsis arenosa]|nr:Transcription factor CBF/NF-Y/archaeal histone domain [Arabidopsis thaliana x Arabidopsis arenosa]